MPYEIDVRKNPTYIPDNPVTDAEFNSRNSNLVAGITSAKAALSSFVEHVARTKAETDRDANLSAAGKAAKMRLALDEATAQIAKTTARVTAIAREAGNRHAELKGKVFTVAPETDPATAIRAGEIRRNFGALGKDARVAAIHAAQQDGDHETLGALLNAPKSFPIILDEKSRGAILERIAEEKHPTEFREFRNLEAALGTMNEAWEILRGFLSRTYGVQIADGSR